MLLTLVGAAPALALPTDATLSGPVGSYTTYRTFVVHATLRQPALASVDDGPTGAPLTLRAPAGFAITAVTPEDPITPATVDLPQATWAGTLTHLAAGNETALDVTIRAPGEAVGSVSPLSLTLGGQADGPDVTAAAPAIEVVAPKVTIDAPTTRPLFPTETTQLLTARIENVSTHDWSSGIAAALVPGRALEVVAPSIPLDDREPTWTTPPLGAGETTELTFRLEVAHGAAEGAAPFSIDAPGAPLAAVSVQVAPPPSIAIEALPAPLLTGGNPDDFTVTVTNGASIRTAPFTVALDLPEGVELVGTSPALTSAGVWSVGALPSGGEATLTVTIKASAPATAPMGAQVLRYSADRVTQSVPVVTPQPAAQTPPAGAAAGTSAPVVVLSTPALPPRSVVTIDLVQYEVRGAAHTYRGEVLYQSAPLSKAACSKTTFSLRIWKYVQGKRSGKVADEAKVKLQYVDGHCLFGTRYAFARRYQGKQYRIDFLVAVKTALPRAKGQAPGVPGRVIIRREIKVGKTA